jgi:hypothetical protein
MGSWSYSSSPVVIDSYTVNLPTTTTTTTNATITTYNKQVYQLYVFGYSVTIKTSADVFFKDRAKYNLAQAGYYGDYGYYYEALPVDIDLLTALTIKPWTPSGDYGDNWSMVGGWSGILNAFVISSVFGLVEQGALNNLPANVHIHGSTIQNLNSVNSALNMYVTGTKEAFGFRDSPAALAGIPSSVQIEVGATLASDATYTVDNLGHWDSCAAHNVKVTYTIGAEVLTTILLRSSHVSPLAAPDENNTAYAPGLPGWLEYLQGLFAGMPSIFTGLFVAVVVIFVLLIIYRRAKR